MKFRKVAALLLAGTMCAATVVGCGKSDSGDSNKETSQKITLKVWSPKEDQNADAGSWLQKTCDAFAAAHPEYDITFDYGVCSESGAGDEVGKDPTSAADVFMYANDQLATLLDAGALARLGGDAEKYVKENFSETTIGTVTVDDALYGIPFTTNTWFMYYNKDVYTEEDVKSLETMLSKGVVAFKLTDSWYTPSFYVGNGCTYFGDTTDVSKGVDYEGDKAVKVTDYLVDLVANPNYLLDSDGSGMAAFNGKTAAAMFSGSWDYAAIYAALGDKLGMAQLPTFTIDGEQKQMRAFAGSKAIGVNKNSKNLKIATELALFLGSEESQKTHFELRNIVPANVNLLEKEGVKDNPLVIAQNSTFENTSYPQPMIKAMSSCWTPMETLAKKIQGKIIDHSNSAEETASFNTGLNKAVSK